MGGTGGADLGGSGGAASGGAPGSDGDSDSGSNSDSDGAIGEIDAAQDLVPEAGDGAPPDSNEGDSSVNLDLDPVGYWRFDEGTGLTLRDSSNNQYDARVTGTITWAAGAANLPKLRFPDATAIALGGGYAVASAADILPSLSHTLTISVWVNLKAAMGPDQTMVALYNGEVNNALALGLHANQVSAWAWGPRALVTATPPPVGGWHHLAYTFDGTSHLLYIDGVSASAPQNMAPDTSPINQVTIGAFGTGNSAYRGMLDDLRVYAVALTPAQVARLADGETDPGTP